MPKRTVLAVVAAAGMLAPCAPALADPINSDAPDAATGTFCVPPGIYQIEQNAQVNVTGGVPSLGLPSLHRFGVAKDFELRLESPILAYSAAGLTHDWVALEGKYNFEQFQPANWPALGILGTARLEADNTFTPVVMLLTDIDLPADTGLNGNLGVALPGTGVDVQYAASFEHLLSSTWSIYGELAGDWSQAGGLGLYPDGGIKYRPTDDDQVMLAAGADAIRPGSSYYVTSNWSHRFGKY